jgi:hypothetical protein
MWMSYRGVLWQWSGGVLVGSAGVVNSIANFSIGRQLLILSFHGKTLIKMFLRKKKKKKRMIRDEIEK